MENEKNTMVISVDEKIKRAKAKVTIMKQIEKLQKEVARLEKRIETKKSKIKELAKQL